MHCAQARRNLQNGREQYADILEPPKGLPPDRGIEHVIPTLPDAQPPFMHMYRLSPAELAEVKSQVQDLLERGLIEPSTSAHGAPILFVKKKTGELRMVVDYRALNKLTVKNRYPLPRIDDLFDKLHGVQYFTSLDAASGFHQILLKPGDRPNTGNLGCSPAVGRLFAGARLSWWLGRDVVESQLLGRGVRR